MLADTRKSRSFLTSHFGVSSYIVHCLVGTRKFVWADALVGPASASAQRMDQHWSPCLHPRISDSPGRIQEGNSYHHGCSCGIGRQNQAAEAIAQIARHRQSRSCYRQAEEACWKRRSPAM